MRILCNMLAPFFSVGLGPRVMQSTTVRKFSKVEDPNVDPKTESTILVIGTPQNPKTPYEP